MKKKIAIIEDDQILLKALSIELLGNGFEIVTADDGQAGIELVEKETPDLILLDLMLPKKSGFTTIEELKKNKSTKNIPLIILTNLGHIADRKKGLLLGADAFYEKSTTRLEEITKKIRNIL
ncbi:response regulator [Candidatus Kaiserbacteria bacterium]|nr:MAG: response regulator [Candidatus Kaiserbacteria bacterium]PCI90544.1 MAG: response regulator [Candidatus Kaiserbacteria bacterium]